MKKIILFLFIPNLLLSQQVDFIKNWDKKKIINFFNFSEIDNDFQDSVLNKSKLRYSSLSGQGKQLSLRHYQKLNPYFNFQLDIEKFSKEGVFNHSIAKIHDVDLVFSFNNKEKSYLVKSTFNYKKLLTEENGGLVNYQKDLYTDPLLYPVYLNNAETSGKIRQLEIEQNFYIKKQYLLQHIWKRNQKHKKYIDNAPLSGFYSNVLFDSLQTFDSTSFKENIHQVSFQKNFFSLSYLLKSEEYKCFYYDTIRIEHGIAVSYKKNKIDLLAEYLHQGKYNFSASYLDKNWTIALMFNKLDADLYFQRYTSNHFSWNNQFNMIEKQKAKITLKTNLAVYNLQISRNSNMLYLDKDIEWKQNPVGVYQVKSEIDFKWRLGLLNGFHNLNYNWNSDQSIIREPSLALYNTCFLEKKIFKKSLNSKLGIDFTYLYQYEPKGYMPSLGLFYLTDGSIVGNYYLLTPFVEAEIKSVKLRLEAKNLENILLNQDYYVISNYPTSPMFIQFGLSWLLK